MLIYFSFVIVSFVLSIGWSLYRIRSFEIYKKPLIEGTIINVSLHLLGICWWLVVNRELLYFIVPGIIYYVLSSIIINIINWLLLSLIKPKKVKN
ncbi:hypothetical protein J6TS2_09600 [Heyndrickxia sporothermodurans]|nr:hypothetical protein J6TS2_09600 [Heyndrickxia sporothermodurans]